MPFFDRFLSRSGSMPRSALQDAGGGTLIVGPEQIEQAIRWGNVSEAGIAVTPDTAMRVGAVFGCVRAICSPVATLPLAIKRRVDANIREDAGDHPVAQLLARRPNRWLKPHQFKRMMQAHVLLRGNAYALKVPGVRGWQALVPLHPDRVKPKQMSDWSMTYEWTRTDGSRITLQQDQVQHLFGLTLDGITGVTPLTYARETLGTALAMERHVGRVMSKGARASGVLRTDKSLSDKAFAHLKESLADFRQHGEKEGEVMLLEEGLDYKAISLSPADLQWIEARKLTRSDVAMYFGVPPSLLGDNSGSDSNWGTGLEQKYSAFIANTLEDHLTMWEESVNVDLLDDPDLYARFNRAALVRGDTKTRFAAYAQALQWGWQSPDEIRALEDMNPRTDGGGGQYYPPPNMTAKPGDLDEGDDDEPPAPAS